MQIVGPKLGSAAGWALVLTLGCTSEFASSPHGNGAGHAGQSSEGGVVDGVAGSTSGSSGRATPAAAGAQSVGSAGGAGGAAAAGADALAAGAAGTGGGGGAGSAGMVELRGGAGQSADSEGSGGAAGGVGASGGGVGASGGVVAGGNESGRGAIETGAGAGGATGGAAGAPTSAACAACLSEGYLCESEECVADETAPQSPSLEGEESTLPSNVLWIWDDVDTATYYEVRFDDGTWVNVGTDLSFESEMPDGPATIEVRACADSCSLPTGFVTQIETLGPLDGPWRGMARPIDISPMGRSVAISCHNCYSAADGTLLSTEEARAKVELALSRQADLIEIDVVSTGTELCASHADVTDCSDRPTLGGLLASEALAASDAALFIEIKEDDSDSLEFAESILGWFNEHRSLVRNGRPIYFRAFAARLPYLLAIKDALVDYPFLEPYVRFGVLYRESDYAAVADFQDAVRADAADQGLDWVEFQHTTSSLRGLSLFAESLGLAVGVWTIPAVDGAVHVTRLREDFDALTTEYRVDQARDALVDTNLLARVDAGLCASPADETVEVYRNEGVLTSNSIAVGVAPTTDAAGTPALHYNAEGEDRFRCDFRFTPPTDPEAGTLLDLGVTTSTRGGYWLSTYVNLDVLDLAEGEVMSLVANSQNAGFALELAGEATRTVLRFGVRVAGAYQYHRYDVSATGLGGGLETLNGTDGYHLVGAYPAEGGTVKLWINGRSEGHEGVFEDAVALSAVNAQVGADPQSPGMLPRYYLDGWLQEATVVDWGSAPSGEAN